MDIFAKSSSEPQGVCVAAGEPTWEVCGLNIIIPPEYFGVFHWVYFPMIFT